MPRPIRLCAVFALTLAVAGCFPMLPESPRSDAPPTVLRLSDEAAMAQVIEPAKEIARANKLEDVSGDFGWVACGGQNEPLYYGRVDMSFLLPKDIEEQRYVEQIVTKMVTRGWIDGPPSGYQAFGTIIHTHDVTAIIAGGNVNVRERGSIQLNGQCRNTTDHRDDTAAVDVTDRLRQR